MTIIFRGTRGSLKLSIAHEASHSDVFGEKPFRFKMTGCYAAWNFLRQAN